MKRWLRVLGTLLVTGGAVAYILLKIDLGKTAHIIGSASPWWIALSAALTLVTVPPMAWRWQLLLAVRGVFERVLWLTRTYFVSYAVGQVLPTSVGGDASRIFETSLAEGIRFERRIFHSLFATHDQKEGMHAFIAKRPAKFENK